MFLASNSNLQSASTNRNTISSAERGGLYGIHSIYNSWPRGTLSTPFTSPTLRSLIMSAQPKRDNFAPQVDLVRVSTLTGVDKEEVYFAEDVNDVSQHEVNSAEEILSRYPLLRNKSEAERAKLNNRVKRQM